MKKSTASRVLPLLCGLLALSITGCGSSSVRVGGAAPAPVLTATPLPTATPTFAVVSAPPAGSSSGPDVTMDGVNFNGGISCSAHAYGADFATNSLVLSRPADSYSASDIEQLASFLHSHNNGFNYSQVALPSGLMFEAGGPGVSCGGLLAMTNLSNQNIEIDSVGLTYTANSTPESGSYELIDACSILIALCPPSGQGTPDCAASFTLSPGPAGTSGGALDSQCNATIPPGQTLLCSLAAGSNGPGQIYYVNLAVAIAGHASITLPSSFGTAIPYTPLDQTTCYTIGNTSLTPVDMNHPSNPMINCI